MKYKRYGLPIFILMIAIICTPAFASVKAGIPIHYYSEGVYHRGSYLCVACGSRNDGPATEWSDDYGMFIDKCPNCGGWDTLVNDGKGGDAGTCLERLYIYKGNSEGFWKGLDFNSSTHIFNHYVVYPQPGKYRLEYVYTTYDPPNGANCVTEKSTITVLGGVYFDARGGKLAPSKTEKWIKQNARIGKLPKPKRKGYKFKGWYTKKKGGKKNI